MKCSCPHCSQHLEGDDTLAGLTVECPTCGKPFQVPLTASPDASVFPKPHEITSEDFSDDSLANIAPQRNDQLSNDPEQVKNATGTAFDSMSRSSGKENIDKSTANLSYRCPHCGETLLINEDSDDYLISCPVCGTQLDLTELEPESTDSTFAGVAIEETVTEVRPGTGQDPAAKTIQDAIAKTSAVAGNVAAAGLRTFRKLQGSFARSMAPSIAPKRPVVSGSALTLGAAFAPARKDPVEMSIAKTVTVKPPVGAGFQEACAAFSEGRFADAVAIFRQAAGNGNRDAMLALAGCLLKGIGGRPDLLSARLWQSRARATASDVEATLQSLGHAQ